jgi:hypothetical protein
MDVCVPTALGAFKTMPTLPFLQVDVVYLDSAHEFGEGLRNGMLGVWCCLVVPALSMQGQ